MLHKTHMRINEIFYSLQGEGFFTGTPAVFIRFSGCNLKCPFCDTNHQHGQEMSEDEIAGEAAKYPAKHVVITGGEPSLQLTASLIDKLHECGKFVAIETNGTHNIPENIDWITLSPKDTFVNTNTAKVIIKHCNELKLVYNGMQPALYPTVHSDHYFLQPCDTGDDLRNKQLIKDTIEFCKTSPKWRLSLQTHKILDIR